MQVIPRKSLGQHFLKDRNIARKIVGSLTLNGYGHILEIGPGTGVLSEFLMAIPGMDVKYVEVDPAAVAFLRETYPGAKDRIVHADILKIRMGELFPGKFAVIGNFPYNLSGPLFFRILENRKLVPEVVCMVQAEVAARIASPPGSREYGILSVLLQAYYRIGFLFRVPPQVFVPPPKVQSAVIRLTRNERGELPCGDDRFREVVKTAFNQRRKVLQNSLKSLAGPGDLPGDLSRKRPEQLGVDDFIRLSGALPKDGNVEFSDPCH